MTSNLAPVSALTWRPAQPAFVATWARTAAWCMLLLVAMLQGCAVNRDSAAVAPELDTSRLKTIYVVRSTQDERGVYIAIAERLRQMGRTVSTGPATAVPAATDAVLIYQAQWQWDLTMYLLELRVSLREPRTDVLLATATSYHTSATRKSTEEMAAEVLDNIFSRKATAAGAGSGSSGSSGGSSMMGNAVVRLTPYAASGGATAAAGAAVRLEPLRDGRGNAVGAIIGERKTFGQSMGMIELQPLPAQAVTEMLRGELAAAGYRVGSAEAPVQLSGRLLRFEVTTPNTALYWDIDGQVEFELAVAGPAGRPHVARYQARCTERTYTWPSEALIGTVVQACLKTLGGQVRSDRALGAALDGG